jgi:uncharacterized membrane protein
MKNIAVILLLLLGVSGVARLFGVETIIAGRIGIAAVFAFTAVRHFVKRDEMAAMLPASMPFRPAIVILSGLLEAFLAILILIPAYSRAAGIALGVFLVLVTPVNVHAAIKKVNFGGHAAGPRYLALRLPLQLVLLIWTYWFAGRPE